MWLKPVQTCSIQVLIPVILVIYLILRRTFGAKRKETDLQTFSCVFTAAHVVEFDQNYLLITTQQRKASSSRLQSVVPAIDKRIQFESKKNTTLKPDLQLGHNGTYGRNSRLN